MFTSIQAAGLTTPRKTALCKGFAALEYSLLLPPTHERVVDAPGRGGVMRWLVVAGVVAVTLTSAMAPAHATTPTSSITTSLDVESDPVTLVARMAATSSDVELERFAQGRAPATNHDASRQSSMTTATPHPSMLLLVGTGLTGLAGMVRRRLARRHRIAW
jgi:microcystin-dependent protein